jgi:4-hydroxy-tetrahydrodipicolinate reductase
MSPIPIMINGLPGNVTSVIAGHALQDERVRVLPFSLTGPEIEMDRCSVGDTVFSLIRPDERDQHMEALKEKYGPFICVDYTHPTAVNDNAEFYCRQGLPFVMGTTGGDRDQLHRTVFGSAVCAIISPNMAKQIVGFQAMMAYAADTFPGIFSGYTLRVQESHQAGKADTSGTAKAMVECFNRMGVDFSTEEIVMERNPDIQRDQWGVPEKYLSGHGWHTYRLTSEDRTVVFEFKHNVNGRDIYAGGTLDAVCFLRQKIASGQTGRVYGMIEVMKGQD